MNERNSSYPRLPKVTATVLVGAAGLLLFGLGLTVGGHEWQNPGEFQPGVALVVVTLMVAGYVWTLHLAYCQGWRRRGAEIGDGEGRLTQSALPFGEDQRQQRVRRLRMPTRPRWRVLTGLCAVAVVAVTTSMLIATKPAMSLTARAHSAGLDMLTQETFTPTPTVSSTRVTATKRPCTTSGVTGRQESGWTRARYYVWVGHGNVASSPEIDLCVVHFVSESSAARALVTSMEDSSLTVSRLRSPLSRTRVRVPGVPNARAFALTVSKTHAVLFFASARRGTVVSTVLGGPLPTQERSVPPVIDDLLISAQSSGV